MHVYRKAARVEVLAPAKLNLFFEVLGKRTDGFHEIETLMVPISLYDRLQFESDPSGQVSLNCRWSDSRSTVSPLGTLPPEHENLATRAVLLLREAAGIKTGARLRLLKRIPSAAGLGGGSSNAAAALVAGNAGWGLGLPQPILIELAAQLGSDVPFFLAGGAAICRGRGEKIEPVGRLGSLDAVVVRPPVGLSTAEVYAGCRPPRERRRVEPLVAALARGDRRQLAGLMHNRLEEAAAERCSWIGKLHAEFRRLDCLAAQMSGSGSSYFAICHHAEHARLTAARLRMRGLGRIYNVRL